MGQSLSSSGNKFGSARNKLCGSPYLKTSPLNPPGLLSLMVTQTDSSATMLSGCLRVAQATCPPLTPSLPFCVFSPTPCWVRLCHLLGPPPPTYFPCTNWLQTRRDSERRRRVLTQVKQHFACQGHSDTRREEQVNAAQSWRRSRNRAAAVSGSCFRSSRQSASQ